MLRFPKDPDILELFSAEDVANCNWTTPVKAISVSRKMFENPAIYSVNLLVLNINNYLNLVTYSRANTKIVWRFGKIID